MSSDVANRVAAVQLFWRARQQAWREIFMGWLRHQPADCLPFETVRTTLHLTHRIPEGVRQVPLDDIVGSVNRYQDFTRHFYPRRDELKERWARLAMLMEESGAMPVSLFRIGRAYFVDDGNHRVSVARAMGAPTIEAEVWKFPCRMGLDPSVRLEDLPCLAAYLEFLHNTDLDRVRPEQHVDMTVCDHYRILEQHIAGHAKWMESHSQGQVAPLGEAVASWYDLVYLPLVQIICERGVCQKFPNRTQADMYVLILEHRQHLAQLWNRPVSLSAAIDDYILQYSPRLAVRLRRLWQRLRR